MTRDTARRLKTLDMDILRYAMILQNLIRDRAILDQESTSPLVEEINKSLLLMARRKDEHS